jgi:polyferredoxin
MITFKRTIQTLSFVSFVVLLWLAAFPLTTAVPVDAYLWMDPLIFAGAGLSARQAMPFVFVPMLILGLTVVLGRFFCGMLCPMGITIDVADKFIRPQVKDPAKKPPEALKQLKYQVLMFILGAALLGVSLVFLLSPLSLITRFYGLIIYPALCLLGDTAMTAVRPLASHFDITSLAYAVMPRPRFNLQWITLLFFIVIFGLALYSPRFWCRYLCPSGAVFALISLRSCLRRQVSDKCTECGLCQKKCPMGAIGHDPVLSDHSECIVCQTCARICPEGAVSFFRSNFQGETSGKGFSTNRRKLLKAGASGAGAAIITLTSLRHLHGKPVPGRMSNPPIIRPPGTLPEEDFLARCVQCGECMKACPTNTLQPLGLSAGFTALYSPQLIPQRGPCMPGCNVCGMVCPTDAIRALSPAEKVCAKIGTAHVLRNKCLAWEFDKKCLICDEFCPYNALDFRIVPGVTVAVPFINEEKCSGCGLCEYNCPVQARAAIVVVPIGALRLKHGSYRAAARKLGLDLSLGRKQKYGVAPYEEPELATGPTALPPGFTK